MQSPPEQFTALVFFSARQRRTSICGNKSLSMISKNGPPDGLALSTPSEGFYDLELEADQTQEDPDFGAVPG